MIREGVHLYAPCWNEIDLLGFFFRHYDPWVDRYVIYDDGSTDGTLDVLHAHPKVEVRALERATPDSFVHSQTRLNNEAWKDSRGSAAWVVLADIDEHYHHLSGDLGGYLEAQGALGVTVIPALGFDLNAPTLPVDRGRLVDVVRRGRARIAFNKLGVFDPDAVVETGLGHGRHVAAPVGDVRLPARDELMLWHYKHLGFERWGSRDDDLGSRRGERDIAERLGQHYFMSAQERVEFWAEMAATSYELGALGFEPDQAAVGPLWWSGLPRVRPS